MPAGLLWHESHQSTVSQKNILRIKVVFAIADNFKSSSVAVYDERILVLPGKSKFFNNHYVRLHSKSNLILCNQLFVFGLLALAAARPASDNFNPQQNWSPSATSPGGAFLPVFDTYLFSSDPPMMMNTSNIPLNEITDVEITPQTNSYPQYMHRTIIAHRWFGEMIWDNCLPKNVSFLFETMIVKYILIICNQNEPSKVWLYNGKAPDRKNGAMNSMRWTWNLQEPWRSEIFVLPV